MGAIDKFCRNCGNGLSEGSSEQQATLSAQEGQSLVEVQDQGSGDRPTISQTAPDTVEKFLGPGERLIYARARTVHTNHGDRFAYVTNKRVLLYVQERGIFSKKDHVDEWYLNHIRKLKLSEKGSIFSKSTYLEIEDMRLEGDRQDLLDLYKYIQSARG